MPRELKGAEEYAWDPPTGEADALWRRMPLDERHRGYEDWIGWQRSDGWRRMLADYVAAAEALVEVAISIQQVAEQAERKDRPPHPMERDGAERHALAMVRRCDRLVQRAALWWVASSGRYVPEQYTIDDLLGAEDLLSTEGSGGNDQPA